MNKEQPKLKVLLIGVSKYSDKQWNIPNVAVNITELQKTFLDPNSFGLPLCNVTVLSGSSLSRDSFLISLENFVKSVEPDETLLVYYSGHGVFDYSRVQGKYTTFLTTPKRIDRPTISGITIEEFREYIKDANAKKKIVIMDCCYSGRIHSGKMDLKAEDSLTQDVTIKLSNVEGTFTMSATSEDQTAGYSPDEPKKPTFFTGALLDVLKNGISNDKEWCSINDIYREVEYRLLSDKRPKPESSSYKKGDEIRVLKNRKYAPPLPELSIESASAPMSTLNVNTSAAVSAEVQRISALKKDRRNSRLFTFQSVVVAIMIMLSIIAINSGRGAYFDNGDSNGSIIYIFCIIFSILLFIISLTLSFVTLNKGKMWLMTAAVFLLFCFDTQAPGLAVKYGIGANAPSTGYSATAGAIIRAEDRYDSGKWEDALKIFALLNGQMPKGSKAIFEMKVILFRAGYYHGKVDQHYDEKILAGLHQLRSEYGLSDTGAIDNAASAEERGFNTKTILYGLAYHEILELKMNPKPTALQIHNAVKNFQHLNGLQIDGDIGTNTESALREKFNLESGVVLLSAK